MIIVWVRHGTVDYDGTGADSLTNSGIDFVLRLPCILAKENIQPEIVFFDASEKNGKKIERCQRTVSGYLKKDQVIFREYNYKEARSVINECKEYKTAIICYTSESLKYFPPIKDSIIEDYMGNMNLNNPPRSIADKLYKNIIVTEYNGNEIIQKYTLLTGDKKRQLLGSTFQIF